MALQSVPDVNIHFVRDEIHRFKQVNIALAVSTDKGIITPVIKNAEVLTILELAKHSAVLVDRARSASLARADIEGGTFTISNLGMHGISEFQAVINPPQGAILALGKCEERVISTLNAIRTATFMRATLSCDHRAIDGMLGAQFLSALQKILEDVTEL
jgi:pyruvate dehydrogenase E2 component (dihydrolipoamide acetyltransferase)